MATRPRGRGSRASGSLSRVHLELGGKAPVVVLDDANLDAVVRGVRLAGYANACHDCTAACRLIAGTDIHETESRR
jgi:aminobutyraldehyde dehydrogenase